MDNTISHSTESLVFGIFSAILCLWIALPFFIIAYDKFESIETYRLIKDKSAVRQITQDGNHCYRIGIWMSVVCVILNLLIIALLVFGVFQLLT